MKFNSSHIKHDLEGQINKPKEQMSNEEQNFYYFKLHDSNNDNRLDGLEIVEEQIPSRHVGAGIGGKRVASNQAAYSISLAELPELELLTKILARLIECVC